MSDLKTLKEIGVELTFSGKEVGELHLRFDDLKKVEFFQLLERDKRIRDEAIKWIKFLCECHDCGKKIGEYHNDGCDEVRCKYCEGQALSCDCKQSDKFRSVVGSTNQFGDNMDFRKTHTIDWIKTFFNISEEDLK